MRQVYYFWHLLFAAISMAGRERWQNHSCLCWWSWVSSLQGYQGASTTPPCWDPSVFWGLYPFYCSVQLVTRVFKPSMYRNMQKDLQAHIFCHQKITSISAKLIYISTDLTHFRLYGSGMDRKIGVVFKVHCHLFQCSSWYAPRDTDFSFCQWCIWLELKDREMNCILQNLCSLTIFCRQEEWEQGGCCEWFSWCQKCCWSHSLLHVHFQPLNPTMTCCMCDTSYQMCDWLCTFLSSNWSNTIV